MIFEAIVFLLVGIFWLAARYSLWGGICMLVAAAVAFFLPGKLVALPVLGAACALLFGDTSKLRDNF